MPITRTRLASFDELQRYQAPAMLYRGQRSVEMQLSCSLERLFQAEQTALAYRAQLESELLREFRRGYHEYALYIPRPAAHIEWMSLMQHHGAPTRLLDFTYSIYVAAYFAFEEAHPRGEARRSNPALWRVKGEWALREALAKLRADNRVSEDDVRSLWGPTIEANEEVLQGCLFREPALRFVIPANPFRMNARLRVQNGIFLAPGDVTATFMQNLQAMPGHENPENLLQLDLDIDRREALERLHTMNISRTSLFPGLDGYAQSLGVHHFSYNPGRYWWGEREQ